MKKFFLILPIFLTIIASVIFAGNKVTGNKEKSPKARIFTNTKALKPETKTFKPLEKKPLSDQEWLSFKSEAELKFNDIDILIYRLKTNTESRGAIADKNYMKKIAYLEEKVRYEKARLAAFEKNQVNWDSFKPGFIEALNAISKTAKELSSYGENSIAEAGIR